MVIETNEEIEDAHAISLLTASMPGVELTPFYLTHSDRDKTLENRGNFYQTIPYGKDVKLFMLLVNNHININIFFNVQGSFFRARYPHFVKPQS